MAWLRCLKTSMMVCRDFGIWFSSSEMSNTVHFKSIKIVFFCVWVCESACVLFSLLIFHRLTPHPFRSHSLWVWVWYWFTAHEFDSIHWVLFHIKIVHLRSFLFISIIWVSDKKKHFKSYKYVESKNTSKSRQHIFVIGARGKKSFQT